MMYGLPLYFLVCHYRVTNRCDIARHSPFNGFYELIDAAIDARPWLETDEEVRNLWIQGLVEDRDITQEEWKQQIGLKHKHKKS